MSSVTARMNQDCLEIAVDGVFDIELYHDFNNAYKEYIGKANRYVIDFDRTDRIDSAALGLMLLMRQKVGTESKVIKLINANDKVTRSLETAQFGKLFEMGA